MFDLIVTGGMAVMPGGSAEPADLAVSGGKIAAIGGPGASRTMVPHGLSTRPGRL